eukprot:TCONS_00059314-protein
MAIPFSFTTSPGASIFDVFAEDSLRSSLKPAWNYLMKFATQKYPNYILKALKYSDEIYYVLLFVMEEYSLRNKSASMTEAFYELKRESTALPYSFMFRHAKMISLLSLVFIPYIQDKLEERYEISKEKILRGDLNVTDFDRFINKWYPLFLTISKWLRMLNYMLYLFHYTGYQVPLLKLTSIQLKYKTNDADEGASQAKDERTFLRKMLTIPLDFVTSTITKMAPLLFYSLSFLETYYQQEPLSNKPGEGTIPPPQMPKVLSNSVRLPSSKKQCPLCHQPHQKPSTLPVSGALSAPVTDWYSAP